MNMEGLAHVAFAMTFHAYLRCQLCAADQFNFATFSNTETDSDI